MPKVVTLETREQRVKLKPSHSPYWRSVSRGIAIGYRRAAGPPMWYVREHRPTGYVKRALAIADDKLAADGKTVLSWPQVLKLVLETPPETIPSARGGLSVRELSEKYLDARRVSSRSPQGAAIDAGKLTSAVLPDFGDHRVADLRAEQLRSWRDGLVSAAMEGHEKDPEDEQRERQRRAKNTANRTWTVFRAMLNWGFNHGLVASDTAWRQVKPFRNVDRPRTRSLTVAECRKLLGACESEFRPLVRASLLSGLRYGELGRLRVRDYSDAGIVVANAKGGTGRTPLTAEGVEFFDEVTAGRPADALMFTKADGTPWATNDQQRRMGKACKRAGIDPPATFHDVRRTYGGLLANANAPLQAISAALRHADSRMTQRAYAHLREQTIREALQKAMPRIGARKRARG